MPEYDYVYLGDTKRVPYGNRSHEAVYEFTKEAMNYLFKKRKLRQLLLLLAILLLLGPCEEYNKSI